MLEKRWIVLLGNISSRSTHCGAASPGDGHLVQVLKGRLGNWGGCDGLAFATREQAERYLSMQDTGGFVAEVVAVSQVPRPIVSCVA